MSKGDSHCPKCGYPGVGEVHFRDPDVGEVHFRGIYDPAKPCPHCGYGAPTSNADAATARGIVLGMGLAGDVLRKRITAHEALDQHESAAALRSALLSVENLQAAYKEAADGLARK